MKNLKIIFVIAFIAILTSCSKNDDEPATNDEDAVFRVKEVKNASGTVTASYQYNTLGKISKLIQADGRFSTYTYNDQGKLITDAFAGNVDPNNNSTTNFSYNAAGVLQEYLITRGNGFQDKLEYTNNSSGFPTEHKYYTRSTASSPWVINTSAGVLYFYNANNKVMRYQRPTDYFLSTYDERGNEIENKQFARRSNDVTYYLKSQRNGVYDDKKAPVLSAYVNEINNALSGSYKNFKENGTIESEGTSTLTYEFNQAGYVTKISRNGSLETSFVLEKVQ